MVDVNEEVAKMKQAESRAILYARTALEEYNDSLETILQNIVASLCRISVQELFDPSHKKSSSQARWLYWYAYKRMTHASDREIAASTSKRATFTQQAVTAGISKITMMIAENSVWAKRWDILRKIIKATNKVEDSLNDTITLQVKSPKGVKVELKQEMEK